MQQDFFDSIGHSRRFKRRQRTSGLPLSDDHGGIDLGNTAP